MDAADASALPRPRGAVLQGEAGWAAVDFISDLHLQPGESETVQAWRRYLQSTTADAIFILGDLFEAWVGDDTAQQPGFAADCAQALKTAALRRPVFFLHGNRDFLVGPTLAAQCGVRLLDDPTTLVFAGQHWLLSHGDALCLEDSQYLRFREQVRAPAWIAEFLGRPLVEREALARQMRQASQARHRAQASDAAAPVDVDTALACQWLDDAGATALIHGHTHRPAEHDLGGGRRRIVLSDWDAAAEPPRLQALRLTASGHLERLALG